ncbi:MAG TPA: hypothetical protein VH112_10785 [Acidimicrobiales bacterium]|nr:hypothetical protein [Acidimicrobiales bacterium]
MIITSLVLLVAAVGLLVIGAVQGNPTMLGVSLGAGAAGALCLFAGNASARRAAVARGVPIEAVLASRVHRNPAGQTPTAAEPTPDNQPTAPAEGSRPPPPIDGYDDMSGREVTRLITSGALPDDALSEMLLYEASHRRRRAVLTALLDVVRPEQAPAATWSRPRRAEDRVEPT